MIPAQKHLEASAVTGAPGNLHEARKTAAAGQVPQYLPAHGRREDIPTQPIRIHSGEGANACTATCLTGNAGLNLWSFFATVLKRVTMSWVLVRNYRFFTQTSFNH